MTDSTKSAGAECPPFAMFDVSWSTTGELNVWSEGGIFSWKTKMREGWWPVVWGWSFQGALVGDEAALSPLLAVSFQQAQTGGPICAWPIFFDLIPPFSLSPPAFPSAVNTNFGAGWIVPAKDGLPMDFIAAIRKPVGETYSACFNFIWNYQPLDRLR